MMYVCIIDDHTAPAEAVIAGPYPTPSIAEGARQWEMRYAPRGARLVTRTRHALRRWYRRGRWADDLIAMHIAIYQADTFRRISWARQSQSR
jgi:hypothetical protein